jgi:O-antigen ligase
MIPAILCGAALIVAQYSTGRGPYPFLPMPGFAVLALAALSAAPLLAARGIGAVRWWCVSAAACWVVWLAAPSVPQADLWNHGAHLRAALAAVLIYGLGAFVVTDARSRLVVLGIVLAGALVQAGFGAFQYTNPQAVPWLGWISDLCPQRMEGHAFRARGFYHNANHLAWLLNFTGAFALALGVWGRVGLRSRLLLLWTAAMLFGACVFTQSRGGIFGMAAALVVILLASSGVLLRGVVGRNGRYAALFATGLLVVLAAVWQALAHSDLAQFRFLGLTDDPYRFDVWKTAIRQWQIEPLFGAGPATFGDAARMLRFRWENIDDVHAHNDWVQCLAEAGLIGLLLAVVVVVLHLAAGWRVFSGDIVGRAMAGRAPAGTRAALQLGAMAALAACAVHSFFDFNLRIPANMLLGVLALGLLASPGEGASEIRRRRAGPVGWLPTTAVAVVLCSASATLLWTMAGSYRAELAWIESTNALQRGDAEEALRLAEAGLVHQRDHSRLHDVAGRAALTLGKEMPATDANKAPMLGRSVEAFSRAVELEPREAWLPLSKAHALDNLALFDRAEPCFYESIKRAPTHAAPLEFHALGLELRGLHEEALRAYGLALAFPGTTFSRERRKALLEHVKQ